MSCTKLTTLPTDAQLSKIGKEITSLKPDGIVVLSAHWQERTIEVNTAERTDVIHEYTPSPANGRKRADRNCLGAEISRLAQLLRIPCSLLQREVPKPRKSRASTDRIGNAQEPRHPSRGRQKRIIPRGLGMFQMRYQKSTDVVLHGIS